MVSLMHARHQPKHARTPRAAHEAPGEFPQRFWAFLVWRDRTGRGLASDPEHETSMRSVGREYDAWRQERR